MTLRRSGGWPRKKRLQAKTELRNKTPLKSSGSLSRGAPLAAGQGRLKRAELVSKRPIVTPEERRAKKAVRARSGGICEVCGRERAREYQHRKAAVHGGEYSTVNGLDVCGHGNLDGCHGRIHQNPLLAYERGWSVRSGHNPATQPVWLAGRGRVLLRPDGSVTPYNREAA